MTNLGVSALSYERSQYSVIPLMPKEKKPLIAWEEYQRKRANPGQILKWWETWPDANVGIITGLISNIIVIDVDDASSLTHLSPYIPGNEPFATWIPTVITGKGIHLYFKYPAYGTGNRTNLFPHIDIRGDGGYVVAPPSIHPNGAIYTWVDLCSFAPPSMPEPLLKEVISTSKEPKVGRSQPIFTIEIPSNSTTNRKYLVKEMTSGNWNCECVGFYWRHECEHIKIAKHLQQKS